MKKSSILVLFFLFMVQGLFAQEIDQLEQAYKDQYLRYTEEIESLQKSIQAHKESLDGQEALINEARNTPGVTRSDMKLFFDAAIMTASYLDKDRKRLKELEEKKQELKIKVLERHGSLPTWWVR